MGLFSHHLVIKMTWHTLCDVEKYYGEGIRIQNEKKKLIILLNVEIEVRFRCIIVPDMR